MMLNLEVHKSMTDSLLMYDIQSNYQTHLKIKLNLTVYY